MLLWRAEAMLELTVGLPYIYIFFFLNFWSKQRWLYYPPLSSSSSPSYIIIINYRHFQPPSPWLTLPKKLSWMLNELNEVEWSKLHLLCVLRCGEMVTVKMLWYHKGSDNDILLLSLKCLHNTDVHVCWGFWGLQLVCRLLGVYSCWQKSGGGFMLTEFSLFLPLEEDYSSSLLV